MEMITKMCGEENKDYPDKVMHSAAGWYIGTMQGWMPRSRESARYFGSEKEVEELLLSGNWERRAHP